MKHSIQKSARPESPLLGRGRGEASYFNLSELSASATAERLAIDNTPPRAACQMLTILVEQLLDPIRRRYGAPIIVTSGYRCPALNTAVGGVANSHHIVGCAADIVAPLLSPQGGKNQTAPFLSSPLGGSEGGCGVQTQYLFHLIVQMQREGAIRFTQLIAEKDYRWLHISYVPGMLRNQIIDVNACASERDASSLAIAQRQRERSVGCDEENFSSPEELRLVALQPSVCDEVTNVDVDDNDGDNQPSGNQEGDVVALLSEAKASAVATDAPSASASALTLKKDYQDSG